MGDIDALIEATERFIREEREAITDYSRKIVDCEDRISWAKKALKTLKEEKENGRSKEEHLPDTK